MTTYEIIIRAAAEHASALRSAGMTAAESAPEDAADILNEYLA